MISSAVLYVLIELGFISFENAIVEFSLIVLGSVALLFIKDTFDFERARSSTLRIQASVCSGLRYDFTSSLSTLFKSLGYELIDPWDAFWKSDYYPSFLPIELPQEDIAGGGRDTSLRSLESTVKTLQRHAVTVGFIDFDASSWDAENIEMALRNIRGAIADPEKVDIDFAKNLFHSLNSIYRSLRRPWHYANDMARRRMLEKFLEKEGELIEH